MAKAYLSLGSNLEPEMHLARANEQLRGRFGDILVSPVYRTDAVGFDGPDFLNAAAVIQTDLDVHALDAWLHALEDAHGRRRDVPRFSSRPLDIDIVFFDDLVLDGPGNLQLPRPDVEHAFVLRPLADIAPDYRHPISGIPLRELWLRHPDFDRGEEVQRGDADVSHRRMIACFEGGMVESAERGGEFLLLINESGLLDMLDEADREGSEPVTVLRFPSRAARDAYVAARGWGGEELP